uniref:glycosyltransferase n=1 Tax=Marinobacterium profundum TaxID=1714300 RepID=UPI0009EB3042|nr:glycosyltransferase [Marinobacterium profundum]
MSVRVLHVYRTFFPDTQGGLEEVVRQISINTRPLGFVSQVMMVSGEVAAIDHVYVDGIRVTRLPRLTDIASSSIPRTGLSEFKKLVDWADIVHYHCPWPVADLFHLLTGVKKPSVVTYHSDIIRQRLLRRLYSPLMHEFLRSVDCIVATSPQYRDTSPVLRRYQEKTRVIPIGIDKASYPSVHQSLEAEWQVRVGQDFFFFIGVLRYYKGLDILIKAAAQSGLPVVIAGAGPEADTLKTQANMAGAASVRFLGRISDDDKIALLSLCRAFVLPSYLRSEAFGVCLLEAQMMAKPLITAEIGSGMSYVNQHRETGLIVPPRNPQALADAMHQLSSDAAFASRLGRGGRERFEQLFTGARMGEAYAALYQNLLSPDDCSSSRLEDMNCH